MKTILLTLLIMVVGLGTKAQVTKVSLQASGLTCSMCSKAVLNALQKESFVEKVVADIKNQTYHISFKKDHEPDFDALAKAVEDAGFSVASFTVTADLTNLNIRKDEHVQIGTSYFHFLTVPGKELNGTTTFTIVDKQYTSSKNYKKYSAMSKKECVQTGKAAGCCPGENVAADTRIYHAII